MSMWRPMQFKDTVKNARKKLEVQMESAMPCEKRTRTREVATITSKEKSEAQATLEKREQLCACIVEAPESTRKHFKETLNRDHEDRVAERGFKSFSHYSLVHKPSLLTQEMNIPEAKAAVGKE